MPYTPEQAEKRLGCLEYVSKQYSEWPKPYEGSHTAVNHCGYRWKQDISLKSPWYLERDGDKITQKDIFNHQDEIKFLSLNKEYQVTNGIEIITTVNNLGGSYDRIGNNEEGEMLLVARFRHIVITFLLVDKENGNYKGVHSKSV